MAFARALATRIVEHYWAAIQAGYDEAWPPPARFTEVDIGRLSREAQWLAKAIGRIAAGVDPITAGHFVGTTYAAALPPDVRARLGVYYTPPALATRRRSGQVVRPSYRRRTHRDGRPGSS